MKLLHVQRLEAPRERVFAALIDPEVLRDCIQGCERLDEVSPGVYEATMRVGVAALKGAYKGRVELKDPAPPASLSMKVEGKGPPGWVRSESTIRLEPKDGGTELTGEGEVSVGGLIAAVGSRLIETAAKKMLADFFAKLAARLS